MNHQLLLPIYTRLTHTPAVALLLLIGTGASALPLNAQQVHVEALNKAKVFLKDDCRGKELMNFIYLGSTYKGASYRSVTPANNGGFLVTCDLRWETTGPGYTIVVLTFDPDGNLSATRIVDTDAYVPAYYVASKSIEILGNALLDHYKDQLTDIQMALLRKIVKAADAKSLMELSLAVEQFTGQ
jgi:hypothetical protein